MAHNLCHLLVFRRNFGDFDSFVYKIKMLIVTAYDELEVSNSQTAVDMCQSVYLLTEVICVI